MFHVPETSVRLVEWGAAIHSIVYHRFAAPHQSPELESARKKTSKRLISGPQNLGRTFDARCPFDEGENGDIRNGE
jgi:hypothetical protein